MGHLLRKRSDGREEYAIEDGTKNCHSLPAPEHREAELGQGLWLVLASATYSGPDRFAIRFAVEVARMLEGQIQVGIRPFDRREEFRTWCPALEEKHGSPIWLLFRDGELLGHRAGVYYPHDVIKWVSQIEPCVSAAS
jgi:hypothetical protein